MFHGIASFCRISAFSAENPTKDSMKSSDIRVRTLGNLRTSVSFSTIFWTRPSNADKNGHACPNFPGHERPVRGHERPQQAKTRLSSRGKKILNKLVQTRHRCAKHLGARRTLPLPPSPVYEDALLDPGRTRSLARDANRSAS